MASWRADFQYLWLNNFCCNFVAVFFGRVCVFAQSLCFCVEFVFLRRVCVLRDSGKFLCACLLPPALLSSPVLVVESELHQGGQHRYISTESGSPTHFLWEVTSTRSQARNLSNLLSMKHFGWVSAGWVGDGENAQSWVRPFFAHENMATSHKFSFQKCPHTNPNMLQSQLIPVSVHCVSCGCHVAKEVWFLRPLQLFCDFDFLKVFHWQCDHVTCQGPRCLESRPWIPCHP